MADAPQPTPTWSRRGTALHPGLRLARRPHRARDRRHLPAASRSVAIGIGARPARGDQGRDGRASTTCTSRTRSARSRTSRSRPRSSASSWCSMLLPDLGGHHAASLTTRHRVRRLRRALTSARATRSPAHSSCRSSSCSAARARSPPGARDGPGLLAHRATRRDRHAPAISPGTSGSPTSSSRAAPTSVRRSRRAWRTSRTRSPVATPRSAWSPSASTRTTTRPTCSPRTPTTTVRGRAGCSSPARATPCRRSCATASRSPSPTTGPAASPITHSDRFVLVDRAAQDPRLLPRQRSRRRHAPGRRRR